ncbi:hypothetical protein CXB51_017302 [Gossypium anomalum]|uniref:Aminotransferase-like plant mobile domain-containing protein n=1 Tax=Gossypium anomalum TaxID=47600 RepID=A0A8J5YXH0_9ROSI|nr:hypothetical protein CXB51_017302 [Gossypium anomalum]
MAGELIRFYDKHISVEQMQMSVDRILQCYIRNMTGPPSPLIEDYLREAGFWHVAMIGRGCKLDPKLISALIERWRPETHTFHLPCGECTTTFEDVHLQLGLLVDGDAVTGSVHSADWGAVCYELLGAIPDNINGGRIEMGWLRDTFPEPDDDSTELEKIRYARAYILQIIGGYLMSDLSRNLVHLRWLLKLVDFRAAGEFSWGSAVLATLYREMCGATRPNKAKIGGCLSLLQSWARFHFPFLRPRVDHPYTFPLITRWNHSASYARLPTCLEDIRLLLEQRSEAQFQWTPYEDPAIRAVIPRGVHSTEYYGNLDSDNRFLWHLRCWMIITKLTYGNCIRIDRDPGHTISKCGKIEEEKQWQLHVQRERRGPLNPRRRDDDAVPSTAPTQSPGPATGLTQSPGLTVQLSTPTAQPLQMMPGWNAWPGSSPFSVTPSRPLIYRQPSHEGSQEGLSGSSSFYQSPSPYGFQTPPPLMMQTPPQSLFYQGGSSSQHPQPESSSEQAQPPPEAGQRRNPTRNRRRPPCGTESDQHGH